MTGQSSIKFEVIDESYRDWIIRKAEHSLRKEPVHITDAVSSDSPGGIHDFYSNADYWWPNPDTHDGLPYVKRDGETNPDSFIEHRLILRNMRTDTANLAAGYLVTGEEIYAEKAVSLLKEFFLDEKTKMNPHLLYAQAIPGVCTGRGIGIIDTLHLIDIPMAIRAMQKADVLSQEILEGLKQWFAEYLHWIYIHPYGKDEMNARNNHSVCWYVQASSFALFTGNADMLDYCRQQYKSVLLPGQMELDGSFPLELARTKPYSYSIFTLDNMGILCQLLSSKDDNLWEYELEDGRGIRKGFEFLFPYLTDKSSWPYREDIEHFQSWPVRIPSLLFAGKALDSQKYIKLWEELEMESHDPEVRRNIAIRQPFLWL